MTTYAVGRSLDVWHTYKDSEGDLTDGTTVTATVIAPDGTTTVYTSGVDAQYVRLSEGAYRLTFTGSSAGTWTVTGYAVSAAPFTATVTDTFAFEATKTASDWVDETSQHLYSGSQEKINELASSIDASATSLTVTYDLDGIGPGSVLSIGAEVLYVWQVDPLSKTVTARRAHGGSTAAAHAAGAVVGVNPNFTGFAILRALNQELDSLASAGLYAMVTTELTWNPTTAGYDLAGVSNLDTIYEVQWRRSGLTADWRPVGHYRLLRNANVTDFPSGNGLFVDSGESGQPLQVLYKTRFSALADFNGDVADTDLPSSAWDIPPLGAAARLVTPREVGRNDTSTQGDTRRSTEVPAGAVARSASVLLQLRGQRISEERAALSRKYPTRSTV